MSKIAGLCTEIVASLEKLGIPTARRLLPGLSEAEIAAGTADLPFRLPQSAVDLYRWSAGAEGGGLFFPDYFFQTLAEMREHHAVLGGDAEHPRFRGGGRRWFPLFAGGGSYYGIVCSEAFAADAEIVRDDLYAERDEDDPPPVVRFLGLAPMLETLLAAYRSGVYFRDDQGRLLAGPTAAWQEAEHRGWVEDVDLSEFKKLARRFNPGLPCWE